MALQEVHVSSRQKAIVVASFGTVRQASLASHIVPLENMVQCTFPEYGIYRAFTSRIVRQKLKDQGIQVDSLEEVLDRLKASGVRQVILQSAHLTPGEEYTEKILRVAAAYKGDFDRLVIGRPILTAGSEAGEPDDCAILRQALEHQLPERQPGQEVVLMGHGSLHRHNPAYERLQRDMDAAGLPVTVGVLEDQDFPNLGDVVARLHAKGSIKTIVLMPLLFTAGVHVQEDMAGNSDRSWKSTLEREGYTVIPYMHGLGENAAFLDIYIQHIRDAIAGKYSISV